MNEPVVVFDCNVYLQALINPEGPAGRCLTLAFERRVRLWASRLTFQELRRVAGYPELTDRFPHVTPDRVADLIAEVEKVATVARNVPHHFKYLRDPDDAHYVDVAVAADATRLVTRDKDLLDLQTDHSVEAKQFRQLTHNRLRVLQPVEFMREVGRSPGPPATSEPT